MVAGGTRTVVATSHVSDEHPNRAADLAAARARLEVALAQAGVPLEVLPGAEVAPEQAAMLDDAELEALRLGGGPYLLLESPLSPSAGDIEPLVDALLARGHRLVLAHPERAPMFQRDPERIVALAARGVLTSVTAAALTARFGRRARRCAYDLLERGVVHDIASDAHDLAGRLPDVAADLDAAARDVDGLAAVVPWLTETAPAAILAGEHPGGMPGMVTPPPPSEGQRRRGLARLLRRG